MVRMRLGQLVLRARPGLLAQLVPRATKAIPAMLVLPDRQDQREAPGQPDRRGFKARQAALGRLGQLVRQGAPAQQVLRERRVTQAIRARQARQGAREPPEAKERRGPLVQRAAPARMERQFATVAALPVTGSASMATSTMTQRPRSCTGRRLQDRGRPVSASWARPAQLAALARKASKVFRAFKGSRVQPATRGRPDQPGRLILRRQGTRPFRQAIASLSRASSPCLPIRSSPSERTQS